MIIELYNRPCCVRRPVKNVMGSQCGISEIVPGGTPGKLGMGSQS